MIDLPVATVEEAVILTTVEIATTDETEEEAPAEVTAIGTTDADALPPILLHETLFVEVPLFDDELLLVANALPAPDELPLPETKRLVLRKTPLLCSCVLTFPPTRAVCPAA